MMRLSISADDNHPLRIEIPPLFWRDFGELIKDFHELNKDSQRGAHSTPRNIALFRVVNRYVGNLPPMPGVFPDYPAPVVRNTGADRELTMMRWECLRRPSSAALR